MVESISNKLKLYSLKNITYFIFNKIEHSKFNLMMSKLGLDKCSIRRRNLIGYLSLITLLIIICITSLTSVWVLSNTTQKLYDKPYTVNHNVWIIKENLGSLEQEMYKIVATGTSASIFPTTVEILNAIRELRTTLSDYPHIMPLLDDISEPLNELEPIRAQILEYTLQGDTDLALEILETDYKSTVEKAQLASDELFEFSESLATSFLASATLTRNIIFIFISLLSVISIVFSFFISFYITKTITEPLEKFKKVLSDFSKGNLSSTLDYHGTDEIGELASYIQTCGQTLESYVHDISSKLFQISNGDMNISVDIDYVGDFAPIKDSMIHTTQSLSNTFQSFKNTATNVYESSLEVSSSNQTLQSNAVAQYESTVTVSHMLTSISDDIDNTSKVANKLHQDTLQTRHLLKDGNAQINQLDQSIEAIIEATNQIKRVITTIDEFSGQIKLIALNAKLEAARLGEDGKGFDVVATHMSSLSTQSSLAVKETSSLINACLDATTTGANTVSETTSLFRELLSTLKVVAVGIQDVSTDASTQSESLKNTLKDAGQIQEITKSFMAFTQESSAVSEELLAQSENLDQELAKFNF